MPATVKIFLRWLIDLRGDKKVTNSFKTALVSNREHMGKLFKEFEQINTGIYRKIRWHRTWACYFKKFGRAAWRNNDGGSKFDEGNTFRLCEKEEIK